MAFMPLAALSCAASPVEHLAIDPFEQRVRLRALHTIGDFDDYWAFHVAKEYRTNHAGKYENATPPQPIPSGGSPPPLRLVK